MAEQVIVVGVGASGPDSLAPGALRAIRQADVLASGARLLAMFPEVPARQVFIKGDLAGAIDEIQLAAQRGARVAVLASGDPGFYGIGKALVAALGKGAVEIVPNLSSVQLAFARVGESWEDAALLSAHGRPIGEVTAAILRSPKSAVLTDPQNTPAAIARALLASGAGPYRAYVCQNLGASDESVEEADLPGLAAGEYAPLNVLVLLREDYYSRCNPSRTPEPNSAPSLGLRITPLPEGEGWGEGISPNRRYLFGHPEELFHQRRPPAGLITKLEVRAVALALLRLRPGSVVWDIGAGSGAVAIEAARLAADGQVYAVERDAESLDNIHRNIQQFGAANLQVVAATAPDGLDDLPGPDAVFVGGSGGQLAAVLAVICRRLSPGGRVVVSVATLENLATALAELRQQGYTATVTTVNIARSRAIGDLTRLEAANPVFLVAGERATADE